MEKLIYWLGRPAEEKKFKQLHDALLGDVVEAVRESNGERITVHLADLDDEIRAATDSRLMGSWESFGSAISFWLPSENLRLEVDG